MSRFALFAGKPKSEDGATSGPTIGAARAASGTAGQGEAANGSSTLPASAGPALVWSDDVVARLSGLRSRLHQQLSNSSRDYALLNSIRSSKIEYCETVTRELRGRLATNPHFEVLQHLDEAHAQMSKGSTASAR